MKIAVTGGNGFVGSHLIPVLVNKGYDTHLLVRTKVSPIQGVAYVLGDVLSVKVLSEFLEGSDALINLIGRFDLPFEEQVESNVITPFRIVSAAGKLGIKKIIHISAAAVYGDIAVSKVPSEADPIDPNTPYALSKALGEEIIRFCRAKYGVAPVILRPTNIYGEDARAGVLQSMARSVSERGTVTITGDGEQVRDFIHVEDLTAAIVSILAGPASAELYNVASGEALTLNELAKLFVISTAKPVRIEHTAMAEGFVRVLRADSSRLMHDYAWKPRYTIKDTIAAILK